MKVEVELSRQDDNYWIATAVSHPGITAIGKGRDEVIREIERLVVAQIGARLQSQSIVATDGQGQPLNHWYNLTLRIRRKTDEMVGLLRGIIADNVVSPLEVVKLAEWLLVNQEAAVVWPIDVVLDRVGLILEDGVVDDTECEDLREIICEIIGAPDLSPFETLTSALPLTRPVPAVQFNERNFVFTGRFAWGTRSKLAKEIEARGGAVFDGVSRKTDYLVVGTFGSRDWLHGIYGTKIQSAVDFEGRYGKPAIISEEHWINSLVG